MILGLLTAVTFFLGGVAAFSAAYPLLLTALAWVTRIRQKPITLEGPPTTRFAILVPAHDEEVLIGRLLTSLRDIDYPAELFDIYVIADNCEDETSRIASSYAATVLTRRDKKRGKGYAIAWALERIKLERYEAVAMVDADSVIAPAFLRVMDQYVRSGSRAVQGYYGVLDIDSGARALRYASFALMHFVRPLGKSLFGGSAGLRGNGMVFSSSLLSEVGWRSFSVVEDVEQHVSLLKNGDVVEFAPDAQVWGEMPASLSDAESQNLRWEAGRWQIARRYALPLFWGAVRRRSPALADGAIEILIPPLSIVGGISVIVLIAGFALSNTALAVIGAVSLSWLAMHVVGGLALANVPAAVWRSLLGAPVYVIWKLVLYVRAVFGVGGGTWVRTRRAP